MGGSRFRAPVSSLLVQDIRMLTALKFVQGAIASKDFVPSLMHFHIQGGTVRGYNGMLGICSPIDLNLDVCPNAVNFVKAIQTCKDTIQLHVTPAGKLAVKSGKFKAFIECITGDFPEVTPEGTLINVTGNILKALKVLAPFIADDASRPWARGILFRGSSAFATNNVILAEHWLGYEFPVEVNIPRTAVVELLRIGQEPISMQISENSVTFHFEGNRWLRTQTYSTSWPDLTRILNQEATCIAMPETLWSAIDDLVPFVDELGRVFLSDGQVSTGRDKGIGAIVEVPEFKAEGCFNIKQLQLLGKVAQTLDVTSWPRPSLFYGDNIRGAIIGMRGD